MSAGTFIAGVVLTILSMASFQEGDLWIISGIACGLAVIGLAIMLYKEDAKDDKD